MLASQKTFARLCDVTPRQVAKWEKEGAVKTVMVGKTKRYPVHQLKVLAGAVKEQRGGEEGAGGGVSQ